MTFVSRFSRLLRNELGRRYLEFHHIQAVEGFEPRAAAVALLAAARDLDGRHKTNGVQMLLRLVSYLREGEFHELVDILVGAGPEFRYQRQALLSMDALLRTPRLTPEERERLASEG